MDNTENSKTMRLSKPFQMCYLFIGSLMFLIAIESLVNGNNGFSIMKMVGLMFLPGFAADHLLVIAALLDNLFSITVFITGVLIIQSFIRRKPLAKWVTFILPAINLMLYLLSLIAMVFALNHISALGSTVVSSSPSILSHVINLATNLQTVNTSLFLMSCLFLVPFLNRKRA